MPSETLRARLRLLAVAGLAAPALMIAVGLGLAYLAGAMPDLSQAPTLAQTGIGLGAAALTMGMIAALSRISPTMAEALKETGTRLGKESLEMAGYPVMIVIVLMAGLSEEVLFRGGLQPLIGLLPAAFLFGFSHGGWRREMWAYVLAAFCSGTLFGLAYHWTGNLWVPVIAHSTHNLLSTFLIGKEIDVSWEGRWPRIRLVDEAEANKKGKADAASDAAREVERMNRWESPYPTRPTARKLGLITGILPPGPQNDICDVPGVLVGHATVVEGEGPLVPGKGPVRTGVTAILPHAGNLFEEKVPAGLFVLNGFGKSLGLAQIQELGCIETPIILTNTLSVFRAADALVSWMLEANPSIGIATSTVNPVVGECNDGYLNDIQGRHVTEEHVRAALESASSGPVGQGAVGAGTGMVCFGFKGGIGSASRRAGGYTLGALVLANFGRPGDLMVAGVPVGQRLEQMRMHAQATAPDGAACAGPASAVAAAQDVTAEGRQAPPGPAGELTEEDEAPPGPQDGLREPDDVPPGSVMVVLATDAPLDARQLNRLAKRGALGLARTGGSAANGSGDFIISFSTAYRIPHSAAGLLTVQRLADGSPELDRLFLAAVEAVEEAVLNALFTAVTVTGRDGHTAPALPVEQVIAWTVDRSFPRG